MSVDHSPAHRGGHCGVVGVDYVHATPSEMKQANLDSATLMRVAALVVRWDSIFPPTHVAREFANQLADALEGEGL